MAQLVKLPSGMIINIEQIYWARWIQERILGDSLLELHGEDIPQYLPASEGDANALWRYLCEHSDAAM